LGAFPVNTTILILVVVGFLLVLGSLVALTTLGKKRPLAVLIAMFIAFAAYISVILVKVGIIDV
jgi:hypothetical protein